MTSAWEVQAVYDIAVSRGVNLTTALVNSIDDMTWHDSLNKFSTAGLRRP